jgi:tetratricopeptide (TPR) repeat protein
MYIVKRSAIKQNKNPQSIRFGYTRISIEFVSKRKNLFLMDKSLSLLFSLFLLPLFLFGQSPQSLEKKASKAFGIYKADALRFDKLREAVESIDLAAADIESAGPDVQWSIWETRARIYEEINSRLLNYYQHGAGEASLLPKVSRPGVEAGKSWLRALQLAAKPYQKNASLRGLETIQKAIMNMGIYVYEEKKYALALSHFEIATSLQEVLQENDRTGELSSPEDLDHFMYLGGLAAYNAGNKQMTLYFYSPLFEKSYPEPLVYEALYRVKREESNADEAYAYLQKGRETLPGDVSLLFLEINHFRDAGDIDQVLTLIKLALEADPENGALLALAGNIYEKRMEEALKAKRENDAEAHFDMAMKYYQQYADLNPDSHQAQYYLGSVHFNRAAGLTTLINEAANDPSSEAGQRYGRLTKEFFTQLDKALPYFQEAEKINPNDENTLIALSNIYAQKKDEEMTVEFRRRLKKVKYGGKVEGSFFKK